MSEMVDELAEALFLRSTQGGKWEKVPDTDDGRRGELDWESRGYWRDLARAAVETMRDPTEAMRDAFFEAQAQSQGIFAPRDAWVPMIDAALAPKSAPPPARLNPAPE